MDSKLFYKSLGKARTWYTRNFFNAYTVGGKKFLMAIRKAGNTTRVPAFWLEEKRKVECGVLR